MYPEKKSSLKRLGFVLASGFYAYFSISKACVWNQIERIFRMFIFPDFIEKAKFSAPALILKNIFRVLEKVEERRI